MRMLFNLPQFWESRLLPHQYFGQSRWRLCITLRILLIPRDPSGSEWQPHIAEEGDEIHHGLIEDVAHDTVPCRSWQAFEWALYPRAFKSAVESRWNNQLSLRFDPRDVSETTRNSRVEPMCRVLGLPEDRPVDFGCELEIALLSPGQRDSAHAILDVVHLQSEASRFRSYVREILQRSPDQRHRYGLLTNRDIENHPATVGSTYFGGGTVLHEADFVAAAHEVGHLLTLQHPVCVGNEPRCYGETESERRLMMGMGSEIVAYYAYPWIRSMRWLTDIAAGWHVRVRS